MARDRCAECGQTFEEEDLSYNDFAGLDVCADCDEQLREQEAAEVSVGAQFAPVEREEED